MAKGLSQSQASSAVTRGGSGGLPAGRRAPARGSNAASAGLRRRRTTLGAGGSGGGFGGNSNNMLRFYTNDAPGLKITPMVIMLVMSLCFIGFVTALHVIGKLYYLKSVGA